MTPLIDVVFLLLIFFMLTTNVINQRAISIEVPNKIGKTSSWQGSIIVRPGLNSVLINSQKASLEQVPEILTELLKKQQKKVIIQPYKDVPLQITVTIMDQLRAAGATHISLVK